MILTDKLLIAAWVFLVPGFIMSVTGWQAGTFPHHACMYLGAALAVWTLVLATKDLFRREDR